MRLMLVTATWLAGCGGTTETSADREELRPATEEMQAFGIDAQQIRSYGSHVEVALLRAEEAIGSVIVEEQDGVSTRLALDGRHLSLVRRGAERILEVDGAEAAWSVDAEGNASEEPSLLRDHRALIDLMLAISIGALSIDGPEGEAPYGWCSGISTQMAYSSAFWNAYWDSLTTCGVHFYSNYIRWSDAQNPQTGAWTVAVSAHYYY